MDEDRCVGNRVDEALHTGTDTVLGGSATSRGCRPGGAGEVEQVRVFGVVELQAAGECVEHALRDPAEVAPLHLGVVVHADTGEHRCLFAAQAGNASGVAKDRQASLLWGDLRAAGRQKLTDLASRVHETEGGSARFGLGGTAGTWIKQASHHAQIRGSVETPPRRTRRLAERLGPLSLIDRKTDMTDMNTWLITGAARGMGIDLAQAALRAATRWSPPLATRPRSPRPSVSTRTCLPVSLDITDPAAAQAAVDASVARFGRIDTLVNNAGTFQAGYFEEISDTAYRAQMDTNFFGPLNVTRAALPVMREQRSGHVITFSSTAGLVGVEFCSAYSASKFALEGWMETLQLDVEPFGITTTIVEPSFFRTELLVEGTSTVWADLSIDDYAERTQQTIAQWKSMNGQQGGDPAKLAASLVTIAGLENKPLRWMAGADSGGQRKEQGPRPARPGRRRPRAVHQPRPLREGPSREPIVLRAIAGRGSHHRGERLVRPWQARQPHRSRRGPGRRGPWLAAMKRSRTTSSSGIVARELCSTSRTSSRSFRASRTGKPAGY